MGIRLDWEIEAEQNTFEGGEDPQAARRRRGARRRLIAFMLVVVLVIGAVVVLISAQAERIRQQDEDLLRATIDAEVAALRIGSRADFLAAQRSATDAWAQEQLSTFDAYQTLKSERNVQLTGQVRDIAINDRRARVLVEEIIDGIPYVRTWFYWRYEPVYSGDGDIQEAGGWYHVPPDYTFWGDQALYEGTSVTISYRGVDSRLAQSMGRTLDAWLALSCDALSCAQIPPLSVSIEVDEALTLRWSEQNAWQIRMPSPYMDRAREDMPFSPELRNEVAVLLAERLVAETMNGMQVNFAADAAFLRQTVTSWLVGQFVQLNPETFLLTSLVEQYGAVVVGTLLRNLQPDSSIAVLASVTGVVSLDQLQVDWRDFLTWRLMTENRLIQAGNYDAFLRLYDTSLPDMTITATERYNANTPLVDPLVVLVQGIGADEQGAARLLATVQAGSAETMSQQEIVFRLVDNVWRRAS